MTDMYNIVFEKTRLNKTAKIPGFTPNWQFNFGLPVSDILTTLLAAQITRLVHFFFTTESIFTPAGMPHLENASCKCQSLVTQCDTEWHHTNQVKLQILNKGTRRPVSKMRGWTSQCIQHMLIYILC